MIPFGRIIGYGNIAPEKPKIVSYGASGQYVGFATNTGSVYVAGPAAISSFGQATNELSLLTQGVGHAWFSKVTNSVLVQRGSAYIQYGIYFKGGTYKDGKDITTDINNLMQLVPAGTTIKEIQVSPQLGVLLSNGDLYAIGVNTNQQLGTSESIVQTWRKIGESVIKYYMGANTTVMLSSSGSLYCCGSDYNGTLLGTNRTTFTRLTTDLVTEVYCIGLANIRNIIFKTSTNTWKVTGSDTMGVGGTPATANSISNFTPATAGFYPDGSGSNSEYVSTLIRDGKLYICGWNMFGQTGLGLGVSSNTITTSYTEVKNAINVQLTWAGTTTSYYVNADGELYGTGTGTSNLLPGYNRNSAVFVKLPLPF